MANFDATAKLSCMSLHSSVVLRMAYVLQCLFLAIPQQPAHAELTGISHISVAGGSHACALNSAGGVQCWGYNGHGELGDGTTTLRRTPVSVSSLESGATNVSVGFSHSCAVTTGGGVKCWGQNTYGRLGDGTVSQRNTAIDVTGLTSGYSTVTAGDSHTCALSTTGGVKCWGRNNYGQLGDGTTTNRLTAVDVTGLTAGIGAVVSGSSHNCALTVGGGLKCWGFNTDGRLGDGSTTQRTTAVNVTGLTSGVSAIEAGGTQSCALTTAGGVKCWGGNTYGGLGDGSTTQRSTAVDVTGLTGGIDRISVGSYHACAVATSGGLKCWGQNESGQLGDGTINQQNSPVTVTGLTSGFSAIAAGQDHTCALTTTGAVKCYHRERKSRKKVSADSLEGALLLT